MDELTSKQRNILLRYLSGEDINAIAKSVETIKVGDIKKWLYDLDTRSRLSLEREIRLDSLCDIERHIRRIQDQMDSAVESYNLRNLTVAFGVLTDKREKIKEEIQKIEAQVVSTKRIKAAPQIKVRTDYE